MLSYCTKDVVDSLEEDFYDLIPADKQSEFMLRLNELEEKENDYIDEIDKLYKDSLKLKELKEKLKNIESQVWEAYDKKHAKSPTMPYNSKTTIFCDVCNQCYVELKEALKTEGYYVCSACREHEYHTHRDFCDNSFKDEEVADWFC